MTNGCILVDRNSAHLKGVMQELDEAQNECMPQE